MENITAGIIGGIIGSFITGIINIFRDKRKEKIDNAKEDKRRMNKLRVANPKNLIE